MVKDKDNKNLSSNSLVFGRWPMAADKKPSNRQVLNPQSLDQETCGLPQFLTRLIFQLMLSYIFIDQATNLTVRQEGGGQNGMTHCRYTKFCVDVGFFYPGAFPTIVDNASFNLDHPL